MTGMGLGELVKDARTKRDLTQQQLAVAAGVSEPMVAHIESGRRNPGADTLDAIMEALRLPRAERERWRDLRRTGKTERAQARSPIDVIRGTTAVTHAEFQTLEERVAAIEAHIGIAYPAHGVAVEHDNVTDLSGADRIRRMKGRNLAAKKKTD